MVPNMPRFSVAIFALLSTLAAPIFGFTTTLETCITELGFSSVASVPTTTYAVTVSLTAVQKQTTTPIKTVTPAASSTTTTSTSTSVKTITAKGSTTTYTSTSSVPVTSTVTGSSVTSTVVITSTITSTTDTYTVPTPSGFTPLASESGYVPKKRSDPFVPRGHQIKPAKRAAGGGIKLTLSNGKPTCSPAVYPTAVTCGEAIEKVVTSTSFATAATRTSTVPASMTTITKSTSVTSTSIVGARSTTVVTSTTTVYATVYPTTSVTSTSTVTYVSAASTVYAACATNNLVSEANNGSAIVLVDTTGGNDDNGNANFITVDNINYAYNCCVACQTNSGNCGAYTFAPGFCGIITYSTTCDPDYFGTQFETQEGGNSFTIGNGPCGQIMDSGPD